MQVFNLSMAFPAGDFFVDMPLVVEQNVFGHIIDLNPRS
jgi:hypothetical protein